jgi:hypothetical protein
LAHFLLLVRMRGRVAQTINSKTIVDAAYVGFVCAGLESN